MREILRTNESIIRKRFCYIRRVIFGYCALTLVLQVIVAGFKGDWENAGAAALAATVGALTVWYLFRYGIANKYPVSSLIILTFCIGTQLIPIGATLIEGKFIIYNLDYPLRVFWWIFVFQIVAIVGHIIYRQLPLFGILRDSLTSALNSAGFFQLPSVSQLWIMGFIGLLPFAAGGFFDSLGAGFAVKILLGFGYFAYAPFVIPFYSLLYRDAAPATRKQTIQVGAYFALIILIGLAFNSRGGIGQALMTIGSIVVIAALLGRFDVRRLFRHKAASIITILFILFPMGYLALVIQTARQERGRISTGDMIFHTVGMIAQPEKVFGMIEFSATEGKRFGWDEEYLSNPFLQRFSGLKFHDTSFHASENFTSEDVARVREFTEARVWALLPGPVLRMAGLRFHKDYWISFSLGDLLYHLSGRSLTGGRKHGSQIVHGLLLFGPTWYPLVLLACMIVTYILFDSFTKSYTRKSFGHIGIVISPLILISLSELSLQFSNENMIIYPSLLVRIYLQYVVIYFLVFHMTNFLSSKRNSRVAKLQ